MFQNGNLEFNTWEQEISHYKANDSGENVTPQLTHSDFFKK